MPDESGLVRGILGYGKKIMDEAVVRGVMDYATKTAEEGAKEGLKKIKTRIFGWGPGDEQISLTDQAELGQAAVRELNLYMESLNHYWTYRFRIIISGIEDQATRLEIYRMILNLPEDDRTRQLEQVCQNPEYVSRAAKWLWRRFRQVMQDREMHADMRNIMRDIDQAAGKSAGTSWDWLRNICSGATSASRAIDAECARLATQLHEINEAKRQRRKNPPSLWNSIFWLFTGIRR